MKKLNSFFLMGSVALAGLGVMSSCSSDDLGTDSTNITDNKAVKTQFALNIPRANGGTRMSAENTQGETSSNFLGMSDILLYSFSEQPGAGKTSTDKISLAKTLGTTDITSRQSSKIYTDVAIPVGTKYFLFYGHGPDGQLETVDKMFANGVLASNTTFEINNIAVDDIKFHLYTAKVSLNEETMKNALLGVLNGVVKVDQWSNQGDDTELGKLYKQFTTLKAGSANSICLALQSLYNNVGNSELEPTSIAQAIRTEIAKFFVATKQDDNSYKLTYKTEFTAADYPKNINLPDGAVQLTFDEALGEFSYAANSSLTGLNGLDASKICFPSSIYYFCSSDLAATADEIKSWPTTTSEWTSGTNAPWLKTGSSGLADGWTDNVQATTRSIAMRQNINYGVASLKTTVKCDQARLKDNNDPNIVINNDNFTGYVDVPAEGFKVTGLLIGGQPTEVGFDFQPKANPDFTYTIYDRELNNIKATTSGSNANYTIVLPNYKKNETTQETVNVAIELKNNSGADFRGFDGIVPDGGKFYLVGQLKPESATNKGDFTNPAVFMSDYQTKLTLNIKSLAKAYNTIPDLRSTKLQFGLSVDLAWQQGLQFDVNIE